MLENDGITGYEWTNTEESSQRQLSGSREGSQVGCGYEEKMVAGGLTVGIED